MAAEPFFKNRLLPLYLCLFAVPVGIALQTALTTLAMLLMVYQIFYAPGRRFSAPSSPPTRFDSVTLITTIACLFIVWQIVATLLNPMNSTQGWLNFPFGYLSFMFLPYLMARGYGAMTTESWERIERLFAIICVVWALIALSQQWIGWRIDGILLTHDEHRPRGLVSHPLTLAYSAFAFWPLAFWRTIYHPRRLAPWLICISIAILIVLTQSRTAQVVAIAALCAAILTHLRGRSLAIAIALTLTIGGTIALTPNPISQKFGNTFTSQGADRATSYPDDRIAFWHAHWVMVKDRPLTGHGIDLDPSYRAPYYARIGLSDMRKKYEAHNMFLQEATEGGLIGFVFFIAWWALLAHLAFHRLPKGELRSIILWTIVAFALASLTQNSFQDGEVRMALSLLAGGAMVAICRRPMAIS